MKSHALRFSGIAALALSTSLGAQQPSTPQAPPAPQAPTAPKAPSAPNSQATFRVAIDYVTTDVIARNNLDQFVADLTKGDFEVYEDGVKQDITTLTLVPGGRVHNLAAPPAPAAAEGLILPQSRPRNDTAGRIFLIIVDD